MPLVTESTPELLLVVIAGPNGSGKTTFYERYFVGSGLPFVNADRIALERFGAAAAAHALEAAGIAGEIRRDLVRQRQSFIFETVLSDPEGDKVNFFREARVQGYFLDVHFIGLSSPALSLARVIQRVRKGGHDVPDEKLKARFPRTLQNLKRLLPLADRLSIYDNSEAFRSHRLVARVERGALTAVTDPLPEWLRPLNLVSPGREGTVPL